MGREIRRVPANWDHPRYTAEDAPYRDRIGEYKPLYDQDYESAAEEWLANFDLWRQGKHPSQPCTYSRYFWEYDPPPDQDYYRDRKWGAEEATHYQVYQTVSEGSPVTPAFATKEELIDYLATHGDFWDQKRGDGPWLRASAEAFVGAGWAPSMIVMSTPEGNTIQSPRDMSA